MPKDYLEEGNRYFNEGRFEKAIESYKHIFTNHKRNAVYPMAVYNLGEAYYAVKDNDNAIKFYDLVVKSGFNDSLYVGGNIMANPYANFSYKASYMLGEIYLEKKDYGNALRYYQYADTGAMYYDFCGNAIAEKNYLLAEKIALSYLGMEENDKAMDILLNNVFGNGLASNDDIVRLLIETTNREYSKDEVRDELNNALYNIYAEKNPVNDTYIEYYITVFGKKLKIYATELTYFQLRSIAEARDAVLYNDFFKYYLKK
jgi:tetratricopeptide (TPR) repeat protein